MMHRRDTLTEAYKAGMGDGANYYYINDRKLRELG